MWEAYGLENEDFLWAGTAFQGGIGGQQQAPCGAVSAAALLLGLRHRCPPGDDEKTKQAWKAACDDAAELVKSVGEKFGDITCLGLLGVNLSDEADLKKAVESGLFRKCDDFVRFIIEKLYELEEKRNSSEAGD
jgi:hypothetical protein